MFFQTDQKFQNYLVKKVSSDTRKLFFFSRPLITFTATVSEPFGSAVSWLTLQFQSNCKPFKGLLHKQDNRICRKNDTETFQNYFYTWKRYFAYILGNGFHESILYRFVSGTFIYETKYPTRKPSHTCQTIPT